MPGDQLPTVRGLAAEVEVNYNTVSKVYQSLEEDGYIVSKRRLGAFVADVSDKPGRLGRGDGGDRHGRVPQALPGARHVAGGYRRAVHSGRSWPPRPSARRMAQAKEQPMTRKKHGADASSSSPSPQERAPQTGARLETGRNRTSRNGAVAFTIIVFAAVCALVLACAQALAGSIGLAAPRDRPR